MVSGRTMPHATGYRSVYEAPIRGAPSEANDTLPIQLGTPLPISPESDCIDTKYVRDQNRCGQMILRDFLPHRSVKPADPTSKRYILTTNGIVNANRSGKTPQKVVHPTWSCTFFCFFLAILFAFLASALVHSVCAKISILFSRYKF